MCRVVIKIRESKGIEVNKLTLQVLVILLITVVVTSVYKQALYHKFNTFSDLDHGSDSSVAGFTKLSVILQARKLQ